MLDVVRLVDDHQVDLGVPAAEVLRAWPELDLRAVGQLDNAAVAAAGRLLREATLERRHAIDHGPGAIEHVEGSRPALRRVDDPLRRRATGARLDEQVKQDDEHDDQRLALLARALDRRVAMGPEPLAVLVGRR
jgi:hypothetical protein